MCVFCKYGVLLIQSIRQLVQIVFFKYVALLIEANCVLFFSSSFFFLQKWPNNSYSYTNINLDKLYMNSRETPNNIIEQIFLFALLDFDSAFHELLIRGDNPNTLFSCDCRPTASFTKPLRNGTQITFPWLTASVAQQSLIPLIQTCANQLSLKANQSAWLLKRGWSRRHISLWLPFDSLFLNRRGQDEWLAQEQRDDSVEVCHMRRLGGAGV